jgi:flagellar hook-associated protein 1 FlgK
MSTGSIFSIGLSGLNAAQAGLVTTSHNIANVGTEGFTRQVVAQTNRNPQFTGVGFFGQGVEVDSVRRQYSDFLNTQVLAAETQASYLDKFLSQATQIDNLLADPAAGLSPALQDFFSGVQDVAANPASVPSRQSMISLAEAMVSRFQALDARFSEIREGLNGEVRSVVDRINTFASQIADLNQRIVVSQSSEGRPANDLLDRRDAVVAELNRLVRVNVVTQSDGTYNVFIGTGQSLVVGSQRLTMAVRPSTEDPTSVSVGYVSGGNFIALPSAVLRGGEIGALFTFRSEVLDPAQNQLGRIAVVLADTFNAQHRLGQDLNGALGTDFFGPPQATVQGRTDNAGSGVLTAVLSDVGQLVASDYRVSVSGVNTYVVTRLSDNVQTTYTGLPQTFDGITLDLASGAPAVGDSFLVQPTRYGARDLAVAISDTALVAAAAPVRTAASLANTGKATISAGTVTSVANVPLGGTVTLTYSAATNQFAVSGAVPAAGPFTYTSGATISFNGLSFSIRGTPADGDVFTLENNTNGVADNRNALLLAQLQTANTVANGTASYQSAYSQLVSDIGNDTREAQIQQRAQVALVAQTRQAQQSFSGVNLDEEAANLVRYQQAYQASGKVLQIASTLFQTLLELGN